MFLSHLKRIAVVVVALGAVVAGAGVLARQQAEDAPAAPPREVANIETPSHVVEPPDMIVVEVQAALPGKPISGERLVQPDGKISLGYYGEVHVAGRTTGEIKEKVIEHLRKHLSDTQLGLIVPDSDRNGRSRRVLAADSVQVYVEVKAYNSKNYYVLGNVTVPGRLPITGTDTVLDALNYAGGLIPTVSPPNIRLVRPAVTGKSGPQVLPVDYRAIVYEGDPATNHRLRPGDRVIVLNDDPKAVSAHEDPAPAATHLGESKAKTAREEPQPIPAPAGLRALERRLEGVERRLDRVIELLGGAQSLPPGSR